MVVIALGDIVGERSVRAVCEKLPGLKKQYSADIIIANGENASKGNGLTARDAKAIFDGGVDIITSGNHILRRREIYEELERETGIIRPANYHKDAPGKGFFIYEGLKHTLCVINLQGLVYMQPNYSPFDCVDNLLKSINTRNIIVDFHAEATSEKLCMGYYLDGRVSAVYGTHTHVPTADARILPNGTGYVTDIGMCGGYHSVLGVGIAEAIQKMRTNLPVRFKDEEEDVRLSGAVITIGENGLCEKIEPLHFV